MVTTTKYVWDPVFDCVTHELDENNAVKAVYHNEPQQYGGVLSQRRGNTSHYHHHDAMGSTRFLTDSSGTVTDTYLNDAWGNSVASTGTTVNPFRWVGKYGYYTDNSTGQIYIRARMYQPTVARWASIDPLILQSQANADQQQNGYMHSVNTVTMLTDPSGLWVFLGGRGSLEGNFGPGDTSSYGDAHSEVGITFRPDKGAFGPTCPHCTLVRFVQIFFMDVRVINSTLPIRQWTLDPYKGVPPYYPDGFWANPSVNRGASSMFDDPNFQSLWKTASGTILSIDFETCAVCSDSSGGPGTCVGEVYACMTWGHSFVLAGPWWNKRITGWKRYVESDIWSSDDDIVVGRKNDPTHKFEGIASEPTKNMTPFLDKYFPNL
jgi:RHS repeat-associated protein